MKKEKQINENKKATRNSYCCDQGHYGGTICSLCGKNVENNYKKCPHCGATFTKTNIDSGTSFGGSDF